MLTAWRLCRFKSVTEPTSLPLAPLTVFTGANSAGKSTIIQSMLLTAQTMQSPVQGRPVVLNGHMSRLGSFTDLVSGGDDDLEISIGFDLSANAPISSRVAVKQPYAYRRADAVEQISVQYSFTSRPGPNDYEGKELLVLQPSLVESSVDVTYAAEGKTLKESFHVRRASETILDRLRTLQLSNATLDEADIESLRYQIIKEPRKGLSNRLVGAAAKTEAVGCSMSHFLPRSLSVRFDEISAEVNAQLAMLIEPNTFRQYGGRYTKTHVSNEAAAFIADLLESTLAQNEELIGRHGLSSVGKRSVDQAITSFRRTYDLAELQRLYTRLPGRDISFIFTVLGAERQAIEKLLRGSRGAALNLQTMFPSEHVRLALDLVQFFFLRSVKYLGPLRDEPKPVYPLAGSSDPGDVGFRGEFTAAVFHVHKNTAIEYISSRAFEDDISDVSAQPTSLGIAVQDWLAYMGVGQGLETHDLGKLGHELKITAAGSDLKHDLTQVGVGVSQVLPILVLALLADPGSTLIFEQPELHLHPKVQSRLADFFVAMTKLGKQCIVETHSEYMINRLRYLAAADAGDQVATSAAVYFVTKSGERSDYKRITLDELGGFDTWPPGFFDESEHATSRLLQQSLRKRRAKRGVTR